MASYSLVYHTLVQYANPQTSPQNITLPAAVKLGSAFITATVRDNRAGNARGATVELTTATNVRIAWDGALAGGETLTVSLFVFDPDDIGDDIKELLFRAERTLAALGENVLQDQVLYNDAGIMISYRLRFFDSKVNAENATINTTGGLQAGERARIAATKDSSIGKNDVLSLRMVRTDVAPTPGIS